MNLALDMFVVSACVVLLSLVSRTIADSFVVKEYHPEETYALLQMRDSLRSNMNLHRNWTGHPCIGKNLSRWVGLTCSDWHVVSLVLEGIDLTGTLPPAFLQNITYLRKVSFRNNSVNGSLPNLTNLVNLEYVLFSYNRFTGPIPFEYTELPNLKRIELQQNYLDGGIPPFGQPTLTDFNVSYNQLQGLIPETGVLQRFPESSYEYNSNLCGFPMEPCAAPPISPVRPPNSKKKKLPLWSIVLIAAAGGFVAIVVVL